MMWSFCVILFSAAKAMNIERQNYLTRKIKSMQQHASYLTRVKPEFYFIWFLFQIKLSQWEYYFIGIWTTDACFLFSQTLWTFHANDTVEITYHYMVRSGERSCRAECGSSTHTYIPTWFSIVSSKLKTKLNRCSLLSFTFLIAIYMKPICVDWTM